MLRHLILLAAASSATQTLLAQGAKPGPAAAAPDPPPAQVEPARLAPYHQSLRMIKVEKGEQQQMGTLDDQVVFADDRGTPVIIRVQNVDGPTGAMTDTAVADRTSLAPRWHSSHSELRTLRLDFTPKRVKGVLKESGDPSIPIDQQVADGVFDSNILDVLIAALPLSVGYTGRLMVYLYEAGGPVAADVAVSGSEAVDGTDAWVTLVTLGGRTAKYYMDKKRPRVIQILSTPAPGAEIRIVP